MKLCERYAIKSIRWHNVPQDILQGWHFYVNLEEFASMIFVKLKQANREPSLLISYIFHLNKLFLEGRESSSDESYSERPSPSRISENVYRA